MVDSTSSSMSGIGNSGSGGLNNSSNSSFYDPFSSMSSFGFFNPRDPGGSNPPPSNNRDNCSSSSLLLGNSSINLGSNSSAGIHNNTGILNAANSASANALSSILGLVQQQQQYRNHPQPAQHHVGHGATKSPTYQSNSPPYGGPTSPSFFGSSSNSNNNQQQSGFPSSNYATNKFPITTFSIEDTFQQGGGGGRAGNSGGMGSGSGLGMGSGNSTGGGSGGGLGMGSGSGMANGISNNDIALSLNLSAGPSSSPFFNLDEMNTSAWNGANSHFGSGNSAGTIGSMTSNSSTFNNIVGHFHSGSASNNMSPPAFSNSSNSYNNFGSSNNSMFGNNTNQQSHPRMGSNISPPSYLNGPNSQQSNAVGTVRDMNHRSGDRDMNQRSGDMNMRENNQNNMFNSNRNSGDYNSSSNSTFGSGSNSTFGSGNGGNNSFGNGGSNTFGSSSSSNTFSSSANNSNTFGSSGSNNTFGSSGNGSSNTFGNSGNGSSNTFGSSGNGSSNAFGSSGNGSSNTFGSSGNGSSNTFGSSGSNNTFGSSGNSSSNTFGSGNSSSNTFGSGNGSSNTFGSGNSSSNTFGSGNGSSNTFGSGNGSGNTFGSGNGSSNVFSSSNNSGNNTFSSNSSNNTFGSSSSNTFGSSNTNTFGSGSSNTFGSGSNNNNSSNTFGSSTNSSSTQPNNDSNSGNQGVRETGIIEKLLHSYGFIQCCERQARLFFHFSQFEGTIEHLKLGDPVEFEMTYDRRTGKPIASSVTKIGPEVVLSEERVTGTVTTELHHESSGELQGRISYENRGECFFLPYCREDIEGNVTLCTGDTVSFQIATNHRSGNLTARYVRLENPAQPVRYKGIVSSIKDNFGFIERADVAKEIFFHFAETRVHEGIVVGDNVEFNIQTRSGKEVASTISKLPLGTVIFEDIGMEVLKGQVLKPVDKTQPVADTIGPIPRSETMQGRLRYRGPDRQELEVVYGEKDQKGSFTMRHGDWVEFQLAIDRRDKQQRATNIMLLEESFVVSGERREEGVISAIKDDCGFINCAERDSKMFFRISEILEFNRPPKIADDVEFTIIPDPLSPIRQGAIRVKYLDQGAVQFEIPLSKNVSGVVVREPSTPWVSQEALAGILPSLATLGLPQHVTDRLIQGLSSAEVLHQLNNTSAQDQAGEPGVISYQLNGWQQESIVFHWKDCINLRNIRAASKVTFDIHQVRRNREIIAANIKAADDFDADFLRKPDDAINSVLHAPREDSSSSPPNSGSINDVRRSTSPDIDSEIRNRPVGSCSSDEASSPIDDDRSDNQSRSSPDINDLVNGSHAKYSNRNRSGSDSSSGSEAYAGGSSGARRAPRFVMRGHIAALKDGFGFIETIAQDGEIFFHSTCLVGDFAVLEVGQEVEYVVSNRGSVSGKNAADMVKPLPKGSISRAEIFPEVLQGVVARPLRGANPDQPEYTGLIDGSDGQGYLFGITSMLNKKEILQAGEAVDFQLDAQGKAVNIRAIRKKLRSAVEAVKGQYGFLAYELEDGKKLFFHMSEVRDHQHLNPGDEVEFVILQNPRNGKSSACSVVKLGESQRPERLLNRLSKLSVDESAPRLIIVRQPHGPDGSRGFNIPRNRRIPGII